MTDELNMIAYRNTFLSDQEGRYVLANILTRLGFFEVCKTEGDMALRNMGLELLENCGMLFLANADDKGEASIANFVNVISKLDVTHLVDKQMNKKPEELI